MKPQLYELERVEATWRPIENADYAVLREDHYDRLLTRPSAVYCGGKLEVVYLPSGIFPEAELADLSDALDGLYFSFNPQNHGRHQSKRRGLGNRGLASSFRSFGWVGRQPLRHDFCHTAKMAEEHPLLHDRLCSLGRLASNAYRHYAHDVWQGHHDEVQSTMQPNHLVSGVYTGGVVNKDTALGGHLDAGNVRNTWNSQLTLKRGIEGGYLALPELGIGLEVADGSFALFGAQNVWHGVTPVRHMRSDAVRYSVVWYSAARLAKCLSPEDELLRIQRIKTEREWKRAGLV